jgi:hypothetical protein
LKEQNLTDFEKNHCILENSKCFSIDNVKLRSMTMLVISWQNYATVFVNYWIQTDRQIDILIHTNGQTLK